MINNGDRVVHKLNPLRWRGEVIEVKSNGRIKVRMHHSGIEVYLPSSCVKLDYFTDEEVEEMLREIYA
jgi:hypothetical protein